MSKPVGTIYLLHFDKPYRHARHYIGWTENLTERIEAHRNGTGANLIAVITRAGINFVVARTWEAEHKDTERRLKKRGGASRICPICKAGDSVGTTRCINERFSSVQTVPQEL